MKSLRGKRVLITGGAGGMGVAFARRFAREGAEIVLADISAEALEASRGALSGEGVESRGYVMDVSDSRSVEAVRDRLHAGAGPVEVLVNNAGIVEGGPFLDVPLERHLQIFRVNVEGVLNVTHAFLGDLIVAREGHLVNMASASGFLGLPNAATYCASKWAVIGFSQSIRLELESGGHRNVGVTTVCPSYIDTGMFAGVTPARLTPLLDPDRVASKTVAAVLRGRPWVLEPFMAKLAPPLSHALPSAWSDALTRLFGVTTGMATWQGRRPPQPGEPPAPAPPPPPGA
jgi:all-trans-retinol dehydrogenase (NAD+)